VKRRNLCNTKKLLAVILAASMSMNSGMVTLADNNYINASGNWLDILILTDRDHLAVETLAEFPTEYSQYTLLRKRAVSFLRPSFFIV